MIYNEVMKITILEPKSYCAGVTNAINLALKARKDNPDSKVTIIGMLVHNQQVVNILNEHNIDTLYRNTLTDEEMVKSVIDNSVIVFSAHGHNETLDQIALKKHLKIYDATCPKVKHILNRIKKELSSNHQVIYVGHQNHPEALAALSLDKKVIFCDTKDGMDFSQISDSSPLIINQTTLNTMELNNIYKLIKEKIPNARIENEICNTTRLRQEAVKNLPKDVDLIIVVGDNNSSNSKRLLEIAKISHPNTFSLLVSNFSELNDNVFENKKHVAIASGASTPLIAIEDIVNYIKSKF